MFKKSSFYIYISAHYASCFFVTLFTALVYISDLEKCKNMHTQIPQINVHRETRFDGRSSKTKLSIQGYLLKVTDCSIKCVCLTIITQMM